MASELGSIGRLGDGGEWRALIDAADARCAAAGLSTITQLDAAAKFNRKAHLEAAHASVLTYTIASADYARRRDDATWTPVGVCGNSLGWYTAVHVAGALPFEAALDIVLSTGGYQRSHPQVCGPALTTTTTLAARGTPVGHAHPATWRTRPTTTATTLSRRQVGGQLVYPTLDDTWQVSGELAAAIDRALDAANQARTISRDAPQQWPWRVSRGL